MLALSDCDEGSGTHCIAFDDAAGHLTSAVALVDISLLSSLPIPQGEGALGKTNYIAEESADKVVHCAAVLTSRPVGSRKCVLVDGVTR